MKVRLTQTVQIESVSEVVGPTGALVRVVDRANNYEGAVLDLPTAEAAAFIAAGKAVEFSNEPPTAASEPPPIPVAVDNEEGRV